MKDTIAEVLRILDNHGVSTTPLEPNTDLDQLAIDSLKFVDIIVAIENHFEITFSNAAMVPESFQTPFTIAASIDKHQ